MFQCTEMKRNSPVMAHLADLLGGGRVNDRTQAYQVQGPRFVSTINKQSLSVGVPCFPQHTHTHTSIQTSPPPLLHFCHFLSFFLKEFPVIRVGRVEESHLGNKSIGKISLMFHDTFSFGFNYSLPWNA